jgi:lipid-binding SYLF domain-containing protein
MNRSKTSSIRAAAASVALFAAVALSPSVQAQEADWRFAGTVEISSTQMAFIISGKAGGGVLEYNGKEYPFSIGGLGVGGIGVQTMNAVGAVYNMDDVSKFAGTYVQARAGATLGTGKSVLRLSNEHGVIMDLKASNEGAALSLGVDGMIVSMK